jgi:hypothetical protein
MPLLDLSGGLQSVHLGHADVEQHDVRLARAGLQHMEDLPAIRRLTNYLDVSCHRQVATKPLSDESVVVGDDYPDRHIPSIGPLMPALNRAKRRIEL